jgi:hypothetical protein
MAGLTADQHTFLQALMARSMMREDAAREMHAEITGKGRTSHSHHSFCSQNTFNR